jgi:aspartate-semialdehyde dehydrogenase
VTKGLDFATEYGVMTINRVGFVGWRGMVGSVLMERMVAEGDFPGIEPEFFTTSQVGGRAPDIGLDAPPLADAYEIGRLAGHDAIVSCQGGDYTKQVLPQLREQGWRGYWIDAGIAAGCRNYIGGNCTVSLMLMALHGLFSEGWVEWVSAMTYQAASGAGARAMRELVQQMKAIGDDAASLLENDASTALQIDRQVCESLASEAFPTETIGVPLAASLIPWIDGQLEGGVSREEWKGFAETNKILGADPEIPVDGICVRIGAMRCHSQAFTIKLRSDVPLDEIETVLGEANDWVSVVQNDKESSTRELSPACVSGRLDVPIGRVRKLRMGGDYLGAFSVGDQLLWGAAEPLRRVLAILRESTD